MREGVVEKDCVGKRGGSKWDGRDVVVWGKEL